MGERKPAGWRTPYFLVEEERLLHNLEILRDVKERSGCKILLAQKAFSMYSCYPLIAEYLDGSAASGLYEARLGKEEFGKETHVFSPAYREDEFDEILSYADHVVFNSPAQVKRYAAKAKKAGKSIGLRINPECSTPGRPCNLRSLLARFPSWNDTGEVSGGADGIPGWISFPYPL